VQSAFWEANWLEASQAIPRISRKLNVHFCTHKRPPTVSILCQPNPVLTTTFHLLQIRPNNINPSTPSSSQWFFPSGFPTKNLYTLLSSPIHATCPAYLILLHFITLKIAGEEWKSFSSSLCNLNYSPCFLVPHRFKYSPQHHVLIQLQIPFLPQC